MAIARGIDTGWTSYDFKVPLVFLNPRIGLNYEVNHDLNVFASAAYTSREPRLADYYDAEFLSEPNFALNGHGSYDFSSPNIKPEHLVDIELGGRLHVAEGESCNSQFSVNGYLMNFTNEIISTGAYDHFGSAIVGNAEKTSHYGIELGLDQYFGSRVKLSLTTTISHNEILQFTQFADTISAAGHVPIGFPSVTGGMLLSVTPIDHLSITIAGSYVGAMYGDIRNSDQWKNDPYFVLNGTVAYRMEKVLGLSYIELKLQGNNLLNTLYTSYATSGTGFFVGAPLNAFGQLQIGL